MKILVLHHVEEMWASCFDAEELISNILGHVNRANYDKIILSTLEGFTSGYPEIDEIADEIVDWSYGWGYGNEDTPDEVADYQEFERGDIIAVTSPHKFAYLYEWIKELDGHNVSVCGGHRAECLLDLCESLEHLKIKYRKIERCIYG